MDSNPYGRLFAGCQTGRYDPALMTRPMTAHDRKARRRAQNRESQKAFRKRKAEQEEQVSIWQCRTSQSVCPSIGKPNR